MYEEKILELMQQIKNDIEADKSEISRIRKEINKLKKCIKESIELKLTKEISETENRLNKLKKILYRLKVCERILNNEEN